MRQTAPTETIVSARPKLKAATSAKPSAELLHLQADEEDCKGRGTGQQATGQSEENDLRSRDGAIL